ncbi:hypothetical protein AX16_005102 [Volvariella volvacea WC 439]|nr:hypothetical protein AX16_005102 [Volvariella volvacea WC 439]
MFNKALTAAIFAAPLLARTVSAGSSCLRSYTVKEGDICDSISAAKSVSTYQLAVINEDIINSQCTNLVPGSSICLGYEGEDCSTTYVVRRDDTCEGIQAAHGINSTILYLNNPQINEACDNIYIGEVLCVAGQVIVPPAPAGYEPPAAVIPVTATPAHPPETTTVLSTHVPEVATTPAPAAPEVTPQPAPEPAPQPETPQPEAPPAEGSTPDYEIIEGDPNDESLPFCDEL